MTIQHRRDTAANWTSNNPIPADGQLCWESDTNKFKFGDGGTVWTSLPYAGGAGGSGANLGYTASTVNGTVTSDTGTDAVIPAVAANAGLMLPAHLTKLTGIATGATVNSADATLLDRANHTGTQLAATISDFSAGVAATSAVTANTAKTSNATHTGDVTGSGALTIANAAVTNAKLAQIATATIKGRVTAATGNVEDLTAAQVRTLLNVADGATVNSADATLLDRANHTGTQLAASISDLDTAIAANTAVTANTAKVTNAVHTGDVTGSGALTIADAAVTFAKMLNSTAISVLMGRGSGAGAGDFQEITLGANLTMTGTVLSATGGGGGLSDSDYGDITVSGGGTVMTIDADVVTNAKLANVGTATVKGRVTAATGDPEDLTATQVRTLLNVADGATVNSADATLLARANHTGTQLAATVSDFDTAVAANSAVTANTAKVSNVTHTGEVTGSTALTITAGSITNTKLNTMPTMTIKGNNKVTTQTPVNLTTTQTTAMLNVFTSTLKGLVPLSGGGTTNFLRADGTFAEPPGGAGIADGDKGDITVTSSGAVWTIDAGVVTLAKQADMATASLMYRKTAGVGAPEVQTLATLKTDLGLTGTNSGDQTSIVGITGTKAQFNTAVTDGDPLYVGDVVTNATHTGDVTGSGALTIAAGAVTLAKQANIATLSIMGRVTAATGVQEVLTPAQARTVIEVLKISIGTTAPSTPATNDLWVDTN